MDDNLLLSKWSLTSKWTGSKELERPGVRRANNPSRRSLDLSTAPPTSVFSAGRNVDSQAVRGCTVQAARHHLRDNILVILEIEATLIQEKLSNNVFSCCILLTYKRHTDRPKTCKNTLPWDNLNHSQKWRIMAQLPIF